MFCKIYTAMIGGIDGIKITVECDMRNGMPMLTMIGDLSNQVKEAKDRVITAMNNTGLSIPLKKITINLAPANQPKRGSFFDLAIAVAILGCSEEIDVSSLKDTIIVGEIGLNGDLRQLNGILSITDMAVKEGFKKIILPKKNETEAAIIRNIEVIGVNNLEEVISYIKGEKIIPPAKFDIEEYIRKNSAYKGNDFKDVYGQLSVKRALEIATAGQHNLLMIGTPGSGKSMLSKRIPGIMPMLSLEESIEISKIYSVCAMLSDKTPLMIKRPFRSPHHTVSPQALAGGGKYPMPGEVSLSHKGVLFLDELPEFSSKSLEILRQPMEDKKISISRIGGKYTYPADFQLIAAMNPCPCGYFPNRNRCKCNEYEIRNYIGKISGPLLDRIDICVEVTRIGIDDLVKNNFDNESSETIAKRIEKACEIQQKRFLHSDYRFNSQILPKDFELFCKMTNSAKELLNSAFEKYQLTARGYHKIVKVARTIADMSESEIIDEEHIGEAVFYRSIDAKYWKESY